MPDGPLFARLKAGAASERVTLKQLLRSYVEQGLSATTAHQLSAMWRKTDITNQRMMTHAEAASNHDGRWMHNNDGPVILGGSGER